jgi:allophanate hydrolase
MTMRIERLLEAYRSGAARPADVIAEACARIAKDDSPVWITKVPREQAIARARALEGSLELPLAGIPFAVKDNIDVGGMLTTAGCPSYAYTPARSAFVVDRLLEAGAVLLGKTNLDQFATGLVGARSPYGACSSVFDSHYISGGSSSGSAVAVASGEVSFALGTDTAGSGRVPAAFNNIVGWKPTRGRISKAGVVPACRSLDCVSVFARTCADARLVDRVAAQFDAADPFARPSRDAAAAWRARPPRIGVPRPDQREFFGHRATATCFEQAIARCANAGAEIVLVDYEPFAEAARLLYQGPWVAERYAAVGEFLASASEDANPVVRDIILKGGRISAADAFQGAYRLATLARASEPAWRVMDVLLLPTAPAIFTHQEIAADPVGRNSQLGAYTNFVNLLDLAAAAVPAGFRSDGLPFGVSLIAPAFMDAALLALAGQVHAWTGGTCGGDREAVPVPPSASSEAPPGCILVAVVGAHLTGQPLNSQLTTRGAVLAATRRTAADYRLFALAGTHPPKPGLRRDPGFAGFGIEVEVWAVPEMEFGGFVALVPPPLAIGNVQLDSGEWVKGFVCEPAGFAGAIEITEFGGWRAWLHSRAAAGAL